MDYEKHATKTFWLSYSGETKNLGCCIVDADDHEGAIQRAKDLGLDPGGMVGIVELDAEMIDVILDLGKNRLIYEDELIKKPYVRRSQELSDDDLEDLVERGATTHRSFDHAE